MLRLAYEVAGPGRTALITDAMSATGLGDGDYVLGSMAVRVDDGVARLVEGGSIAGSTLTMDVAFRRGVQELGMSLPDAVQVTSLTPARLLGLAGSIGSIAVGKAADLLVLSDSLEVDGVLKDGVWITEP
jgi:N-acetylglucosamine-6-phosphate deacetylase